MFEQIFAQKFPIGGLFCAIVELTDYLTHRRLTTDDRSHFATAFVDYRKLTADNPPCGNRGNRRENPQCGKNTPFLPLGYRS
ncbi:MAG: hypothetical protein H6672_22310 [Anaerolineaceae bacterium]|nr:hypothetical protein [Anaerolineaceae bacterium]